MRIDAHHHFWPYTSEAYGWIDDSMHLLRHDFLPEDLSDLASAAGINGTVAVQSRQSVEDTQWLLSLAAQSALVKAVVGWAPIASPDFPVILDSIAQSPLLAGLRHVVQAEPDGFLEVPDFNRGIAALLPLGLVYDILIYARQLPEATSFIDRHPNQPFVLDHIAKPDIKHGGFDYWNTSIRDLARRPNVYCKLSGMVTEAHFCDWSPSQLEPYFDTVLDTFGPQRLMFGSDWPVLNVACTYSRWVDIVDGWLRPLTSTERASIQGETANTVYSLNSGL